LVASSELPANRSAVHIWHAPRPADTDIETTNQHNLE
jgi:hypothetical protein